MALAVRCRRWAAARCPPSAAAARTELPPPSPPPPARRYRRRGAPLPRRLSNALYADSAEGPRLFHTAPMRAGGRTRLTARLDAAPRSQRRLLLLRPSPPPHTPARTAPARLSQHAAPAASGSAPRLSVGLCRALAAAPHVSFLAPASRGAKLGCYFLPARPLFAASCVREKGSARRPFWNRAHAGTPKPRQRAAGFARNKDGWRL